MSHAPDPKTYYEKRMVINENFVDGLFKLIHDILPPAYQESADVLWNSYVEAVGQLDLADGIADGDDGLPPIGDKNASDSDVDENQKPAE